MNKRVREPLGLRDTSAALNGSETLPPCPFAWLSDWKPRRKSDQGREKPNEINTRLGSSRTEPQKARLDPPKPSQFHLLRRYDWIPRDNEECSLYRLFPSEPFQVSWEKPGVWSRGLKDQNPAETQ